jgi:hypothetical protein
VAEADTARTGLSRKRKLVVYTLIVLAAVIALVATLTIWVKRELLDTDNFVETSSELLQNEKVQSALAIRLSDALFTNVDVQAQLAERLPAQVQGLAAPAAAALQNLSVQAAEQLLAGPRVQALFEEVVRRAHTRLVDVLEGNEGGRITTEGGDVVLDLNPLVQRLHDRLGLSGEVPAGAGQILLLESDELESAQKAVRAIKVMSVFVAIAVIVLLGLAVYLARGRRREALRATGIALLVAGVLVLVLRRVLGNALVDSLASAESRPAADAVWLIGTGLLKDIATALAAYGIAVIVGAWLAGPTRLAVRIRRALAPAMHRPALVYGVAFLVFLLVLLWGPTDATRQIWGILVLGALFAVGVEVLRRQTVREFPAETPAEAPPPQPA